MQGLAQLIDALAPAVDTFLLVNAPTASTSRMWDIEAVADYAAGQGPDAVVDADFDSRPSRCTTPRIDGLR
ncbi:MAG: hypothetical protein U0163_12740 [Gemmatimonadaceae bacterium]